MDIESTYLISVSSVFACAALAFTLLLFVNAPYGRHHSRKFGPELDVRLAWLIMETPVLVSFGVVYFLGPASLNIVPLIFFAMWQAHYVHRTLIFPFRMKLSGKKASVLTTVLAVMFNITNGSINAFAISGIGSNYEVSWLWDPRFICGALLFVIGFVINRKSDSMLRKLRGPGEEGYKIPKGGLFRYVSCPNYFGELIEWAGWALATFNLAGLAFFVFSAANLVPRAIAHHRWYKERFPDYPKSRRALVPGIF